MERTVRRRPGHGAWRERQDWQAKAVGVGATPSLQKEDPVQTRLLGLPSWGGMATPPSLQTRPTGSTGP